MSDNSTLDNPDDFDLDAAEYVLATLAPDRVRAHEERMRRDLFFADAFAASVSRWQERLFPLHATVPQVLAPADGWARLERALWSPKPPGRLASWIGRLSWAVGGAAFAAVAGAAVLVPKLYTSVPAVAALVPPDGAEPAYQVMLTRDGYAMVVAVNPDYPADGVLQLWMLDGATPVSLGLLPAKGRLRLQRQLVPGAKLLISREPRGGSRELGPSGPVVYSGRMIRG